MGPKYYNIALALFSITARRLICLSMSRFCHSEFPNIWLNLFHSLFLCSLVFKSLSACFLEELKRTRAILPTLREILFVFNQFTKLFLFLQLLKFGRLVPECPFIVWNSLCNKYVDSSEAFTLLQKKMFFINCKAFFTICNVNLAISIISFDNSMQWMTKIKM